MRPKAPNTLVPVAFYIRSAEGDPDNSLKLQLRELQHHADANRMDAVRIFFDVRGSRSHFNEMMREATGGNPAFSRILVAELSKLAPTSSEFIEVMAKLDAVGHDGSPGQGGLTDPARAEASPSPKQPLHHGGPSGQHRHRSNGQGSGHHRRQDPGLRIHAGDHNAQDPGREGEAEPQPENHLPGQENQFRPTVAAHRPPRRRTAQETLRKTGPM